ncbi:hypothetical protein PMAYCL1PPCAC_04885, partial [Pristionchus mayeri]
HHWWRQVGHRSSIHRQKELPMTSSVDFRPDWGQMCDLNNISCVSAIPMLKKKCDEGIPGIYRLYHSFEGFAKDPNLTNLRQKVADSQVMRRFCYSMDYEYYEQRQYKCSDASVFEDACRIVERGSIATRPAENLRGET